MLYNMCVIYKITCKLRFQNQGEIVMKNVKKTLGIVVTVAAIAVAGSIFVSVSGVTRSDKIQLKMSHNQSKDSEIADCIAKVAEFAAEDPSMNLEVDIYASCLLYTSQGKQFGYQPRAASGVHQQEIRGCGDHLHRSRNVTRHGKSGQR